jgi:hypothetical protein
MVGDATCQRITAPRIIFRTVEQFDEGRERGFIDEQVSELGNDPEPEGGKDNGNNGPNDDVDQEPRAWEDHEWILWTQDQDNEESELPEGNARHYEPS